MNTQRHPIVLLSLFALTFMPVAHADVSTDELLRRGRDAWNNERCVEVGEYLYAYQLRNPPALQTDANHRNEVAQAISWCESHATVGSGTKADESGHVPPPPVRPSLGLTSTAVSADRRCDIYARLAVAQNDANLVNHCNLTGGRWVSDHPYHYNYCKTVAASVTAAESLTRTNLLNACAQ